MQLFMNYRLSKEKGLQILSDGKIRRAELWKIYAMHQELLDLIKPCGEASKDSPFFTSTAICGE